jgi:FkbM family methyltransferase
MSIDWLKDEADYFNKIKEDCNVIFDIGASYSPYVDFEKEVHYFDPQPSVIELLKDTPKINTKSVYNCFGLSDEAVVLPFWQPGDFVYEGHTKLGDFEIRVGADYMRENNLTSIDFLKIDVEGYEFKVLKGFGDYLHNVKYIQFEYGGVWRDMGTNLLEVVTYLNQFGFSDYSRIDDPKIITDFTDHWELCNITCVNKKLLDEKH